MSKMSYLWTLSNKMIDNKIIQRAQGCLVGQLAGDSLGSLVEFMTPEKITKLYPDGVRYMIDGGVWNTIAGQSTDDGEMALILARSLPLHQQYVPEIIKEEYKWWLSTEPFDVGATCYNGITGTPIYESQANGALMRCSPIGIFGYNLKRSEVKRIASIDAGMTHPNELCVEINALFCMAIATAVNTGCTPRELYNEIKFLSQTMSDEVQSIIIESEDEKPEYGEYKGWVVVAFKNALYQLLHAESVEEGIVDTISEGGDTDTNAAICGALLGSVYGVDKMPFEWVCTLQKCESDENATHTRPRCFWPTDVLELAIKLLH